MIKDSMFDYKKNHVNNKLNTGVVDLFCGIGGLTHGFVLEKFNVIAGIDADESCQYAYEQNNGSQFILKDITQLKSTFLTKLFGNVKTKILVGCAPCQAFSQYASQHAHKNSDWTLVEKFIDLITDVQPDIISMENVPRLQYHDVFQKFYRSLEKQGYRVFWDIVYGPDYGLPQQRKRLILLASKLGEINIIDKTHRPDTYRTVRDVIGKMPILNAGDMSEEDPLHICSKLSVKNLARIRASFPGGTWHDWPNKLRAPCHHKKTGKGYVGVYGRMQWDQPAPTITTQFFGYGNGRFGHPTQDRAISLREGSLLQSFPKSYKFVSPDSKPSIKFIGRHIGNAVPVTLAQVIAKSIQLHLERLSND